MTIFKAYKGHQVANKTLVFYEHLWTWQFPAIIPLLLHGGPHSKQKIKAMFLF